MPADCSQAGGLSSMLLGYNGAPPVCFFVPLAFICWNRYAHHPMPLHFGAEIQGNHIHLGCDCIPDSCVWDMGFTVQCPHRKPARKGNHRLTGWKHIQRMKSLRCICKAVYACDSALIRSQRLHNLFHTFSVQHLNSPPSPWKTIPSTYKNRINWQDVKWN